jgi:hypothetical protein
VTVYFSTLRPNSPLATQLNTAAAMAQPSSSVKTMPRWPGPYPYYVRTLHPGPKGSAQLSERGGQDLGLGKAIDCAHRDQTLTRLPINVVESCPRIGENKR